MSKFTDEYDSLKGMTDAEIVAQYRAWVAEYDALEADDYPEWTPADTERHGDLWSLIFEGKHDALDAAIREIDRLQASRKAVLDQLVHMLQLALKRMPLKYSRPLNEQLKGLMADE